MEYWLRVILAVVSLYVAIRLMIFAGSKRSLLLGSFSLGLLFLFSHQGAIILIDTVELGNQAHLISQLVIEWSSIVAIAFILCGLANLIREARPEVAQFPLFFTALPLLIILTYPFAYETSVINNWLMKIYEGGALAISLIMYGYLTIAISTKSYFKILGGVFLLAASYSIYWFYKDITVIQPWLWYVTLILGISLFYSGYKDQVIQSDK